MPSAASPPTSVPKISVNPDVLKWAREERGLTRADAADRLGIPDAELAAYESGHRKPLVGMLRFISSRYQINFVSLLLPERPPPQPKLHDFRTHPGRGERPLTMETLVAIQDVRDALRIFAELRADDQSLVPLPNLDKMQPREAPELLAARQRTRFGVGIKSQQEWRSEAAARDEWRRRIEAQGIFVYIKRMDIKDCRGFSIIHEGLAAICVNDREDSPGAETFTLFHEYAHLLRRQTGISDENRRNSIERYCNRFAASFLVPLVPLRAALNSPSKPADYPDDEIRRLARLFNVSATAMALRLEHSGLAPRGFFTSHTAAWAASYAKAAQRPTRPMLGGPTTVERAARILGRHHTRTILRAYEHGALNAADAHNMLDVPVASFQTLGSVFE
jgi:Zn-dependent peptidase ImmA (M78 family)/DNA-binding XRE family transcriptional regulator